MVYHRKKGFTSEPVEQPLGPRSHFGGKACARTNPWVCGQTLPVPGHGDVPSPRHAGIRLRVVLGCVPRKISIHWESLCKKCNIFKYRKPCNTHERLSCTPE